MQKVLPKGNLLGARNLPLCAQCSVIRWSHREDLSRQAVAVGRSDALSIAVRGDGGHSNNGFIISHKRVLEKNHGAVYQAIATGLYGSITTFSSWNSEATSVLIQANEYPPDNAQRVVG